VFPDVSFFNCPLYFKTHVEFSTLHFFVGMAIDVVTGKWLGRLSGLGAGVDSFFEYLLKVSF